MAGRCTATGKDAAGADVERPGAESSRRRDAEISRQSASIQRVSARSHPIASSITTNALPKPTAVGLRESTPITRTTSIGEAANASRNASPPVLDCAA